jgi:hypothetical protein
MSTHNHLQPHEMGEIFERYVREKLFDRTNYDLVDRSLPFTTSIEHFAESALKPDFRFRDVKTGKEFYVEAKFRTLHPEYYFYKCSYKDQLERYRFYARECPTFIIIGLGEQGYPDMLSLIPLEKANYTYLFLNHIRKFDIPVNQPVPSQRVWGMA